MKKIFLTAIFPLAIIAIATVSCNNTRSKEAAREQKPLSAHKTDTVNSPVTPAKKGAFSIAPMITDYLLLKNALVSDDDKAAADAGKKLLVTLNNVDMRVIPADKLKAYMDIADDAKENAEHIGNNAGKIDHQREHLASLSKDVNDLVVLFGTPQKLYQDHCPMFNDGKGAIWLSETKAIRNPYYGAKMPGCGSLKKEL